MIPPPARRTGSNSGESEHSRKEAADMGLPGHGLPSVPGIATAPTPKMKFTPNHTGKEREDARIAQYGGQRHRRHVIGFPLVMADHAQRPTALEYETHRRSHGAGDRRRGADHRRSSPICVTRCAAAPAAAVTAQKIRNRTGPNRRAIGGPMPPARSR